MYIIFIIAIFVSGISFIIYGISLLISKKMQDEFIRFELEKYTKLIGSLELLGGIGMIVGLKFDYILLISSAGLALLMMMGFIVRLKLKDGFWLSFPSFFYMLLNQFIFLYTVIFLT